MRCPVAAHECVTLEDYRLRYVTYRLDPTFKNFKHLRRARHTHHPVDDAKGNAEALLTMKEEMGLKIRL
mgnify:FL=1